MTYKYKYHLSYDAMQKEEFEGDGVKAHEGMTSIIEGLGGKELEFPVESTIIFRADSDFDGFNAELKGQTEGLYYYVLSQVGYENGSGPLIDDRKKPASETKSKPRNKRFNELIEKKRKN